MVTKTLIRKNEKKHTKSYMYFLKKTLLTNKNRWLNHDIQNRYSLS